MEKRPARDQPEDFARAAIRVGVLLAVLVAAHLCVPVYRYHRDRFGNVTFLDPFQKSAYDPASLKGEPSVVVTGDSQLQMTGEAQPNGSLREGTTETLLPLLAKGLDARYPPRGPREYVRLAGPDYTPIEELATLALWFRRTRARPIPVIISLDIVAAARPTRVQRPLLELFWEDPAAAEDLLATFGKLPDGAEIAKLLARPAATHSEEAWCDRLEFELSKRSREHKLYYGEPYTTPLAPLFWLERIERPVVDALFGKRPPPPPPRPQPTTTEKPPFIRALVRYVRERGSPAICYASPRNPALFPLSPTMERILESVRKDAVEEGCTFIDAWHSLREPENWGYFGPAHDESHITAAGHRALASLLLYEGENAGAWQSLASEPKEGRAP